jgi:hypothetical protein
MLDPIHPYVAELVKSDCNKDFSMCWNTDLAAYIQQHWWVCVNASSSGEGPSFLWSSYWSSRLDYCKCNHILLSYWSRISSHPLQVMTSIQVGIYLRFSFKYLGHMVVKCFYTISLHCWPHTTKNVSMILLNKFVIRCLKHSFCLAWEKIFFITAFSNHLHALVHIARFWRCPIALCNYCIN